MNNERKEQPFKLQETVYDANHPDVLKTTQIDPGSGSRETIASSRNISRGNLTQNISLTQQSRIHCKMPELSSQIMEKTNRYLRHVNQESSQIVLTNFQPSSFILLTSDDGLFKIGDIFRNSKFQNKQDTTASSPIPSGTRPGSPRSNTKELFGI